MGNGVEVVVRRLRARQGEIEEAIFARVLEAVPDSAQDGESEYVQGLRTAVGAAVEFGLTGIAQGEGDPPPIPREAVAQARRAARSGVSLEAVLRRYIAGHALLWDYVMGEADRLVRTGRASGLREMSRVQAALLDQLVVGVTREHVAELQRAGGSREHRLLERVRLLLAGEDREGEMELSVLSRELDYALDGEHLGVLAVGSGAAETVRELAVRLDRRLLSVPCGERSVWAWLGGEHEPLGSVRLRSLAGEFDDTILAVGEPGRGVEGWRRTHHQAQAALTVALRRPRPLTRYADVALLASALQDPVLGAALVEAYLVPLDEEGDRGQALRETLRAYLDTGRSVSSAAAALGVARSTIEHRLRAVEECLGASLHRGCPELEVALALEETGSEAFGSSLRVN